MCLRNTNLDTGHRNPAHLLFKRGSQLEESRPEARVDLKRGLKCCIRAQYEMVKNYFEV